MDQTQKKMDIGKYKITIEGVLDQKWCDWFDGFNISPIENKHTLLSGQVNNQSALHGILSKIRDLGLTLLSVEKLENQNDDELGDG